MSAPTTDQVRALVASLRRRLPQEAVFGIRFPAGSWTGPDSLDLDGGPVRVRTCASPLEVRERLLEFEGAGEPLAILTPLSDQDLGSDVLARLARRRLFAVEPWRILMDLMDARHVDPRIAGESWLPEVLLACRPPEGWPALPSGILDAQTAWGLVLRHRLGLETLQIDAIALVRWAAEADRGTALAAQPEGLRKGLRDWLLESAGSAAGAVLDCIEAGSGADVLALGLACGVIFHPEGQGVLALERAAGRLERFTGGRRLTVAAGRGWAAAAETVVRGILSSSGLRQARPVLERCDALLRELEADQQVGLSAIALGGFEQRLQRLGAALEKAVEVGQAGLTDVEAALSQVEAHDLARHQPERLAKARMATRLARWLATASPAAASFEEAVVRYSREGGFVDRARRSVAEGETAPGVQESYRRLLAACTARREEGSRHFGNLLSGWLAAGSAPSRVLVVEELLAKLVAPLAGQAPVLLLVMDGMSQPVWRELLESILEDGWVELAQKGAEPPGPVVAAFPTVTEVSRTSLLCGRLTTGGQAEEKQGFASHRDLLARSATRLPPVLFHKPDLTEEGHAGLAAGVGAELASERRIVGVVVNAIDDHLLKGDQVAPRWTVDFVRPLRALLQAARDGGRVVIATSDHGHIPEQGTEYRATAEGERWRSQASPGDVQPDEVSLVGPRVLLGGGKIVTPWTESVRYGSKRNGYHGGASPAEVVIPLAVLSTGRLPEGWQEVASFWPDWWESAGAPVARRAPTPVTAAVPEAPARQGRLPFEPGAEAAPAAAAAADWIDQLLRSPVYASQTAAAGRAMLPEAQARQLLESLQERGGRLTRQALGQRLGVPLLRVNGLVAAMRRVLNVDGYPVLSVDDASETIDLNLGLLRTQFELD